MMVEGEAVGAGMSAGENNCEVSIRLKVSEET